jgi:hypothetical protein
MKIFTGKVPENPHVLTGSFKGMGEFEFNLKKEANLQYYAVEEYRQSILNQCVDIDLNKLLTDFVAECIENGGQAKRDFEQFAEQAILKALNELTGEGK